MASQKSLGTGKPVESVHRLGHLLLILMGKIRIDGQEFTPANAARYHLRTVSGSRAGLALGEGWGTIAPCQRMLAPCRQAKSDFFGDYWHLQNPKNHILVPSSEESAPRRKIPGATPALVYMRPKTHCTLERREKGTKNSCRSSLFS